jgi:type IV pilus assembly protein PilY1
MKKIALLICLVVSLAASRSQAAFTEPAMVDYTAYPVFTADTVPPNIMVILDNSGSMNFNAYGDYPKDCYGSYVDDGVVTANAYEGEPYAAPTHSITVAADGDDMEENAGNVYNDSYDIDLGAWPVGIRFQNVAIPQGAKIVAAYIDFTADQTSGTSYATISIDAEDSDNAAEIVAGVTYDITSRTGTSASACWYVEPWTAGDKDETTTTSNLGPIVQELVDRAGWTSGNAMLFRITGSGVRCAKPVEKGATSGPVLRIIVQGIDASGPKTRYYGYFNPDYFYRYTSNVFYPAYKKSGYDFSGNAWNVQDLSGSSTTLSDAAIISNGLWDGNFANWVAMRRVDVLRKVLMGGKATSRTGGGNQQNQGEVPTQTNRIFSKIFDTSGDGPVVSPYNGNITYRMKGGYIYVGSNNYKIDIQRDVAIEPEDFHEGNLAGVLQRVGDKARWGNIWFNLGYGNSGSGGEVKNVIGTNLVDLVTSLQNTGCDTSTPLAESFYVAMQYFAQRDPQSGLDYSNSAVPNANDGQDPYYNKDSAEFISCAKSFVILLTDGASTMDSHIPSQFKDWDGDGDITACDEASGDCDYGSGTDYLDDLALYARTTDLRPDSESDGLPGEQNIILYNIFASFGAKDKDARNARSLLMDASRNGGFEDRFEPLNNLPDGDYDDPPEERLEWDKNGDAVPDTFYEASDGYELEAQLLKAITDILERASSGTASSVLATNTKGAGSSLQAYFRPVVTEGIYESTWRGYLQTLWTDPWGNLREDSNGNLKLDLYSSGAQNAAADVDRIVEIFTDDTDTKVRRYTSHYMYNSDNGETDTCMVSDCSKSYEVVSLESVQPLFEAGKRLAERVSDPGSTLPPRTIFTFIDADQDNTVDTGSEVISFNTTEMNTLKPYLGVRDGTYWGDLGSTHDGRATNLINWVRGEDQAGLRNRTLNGETWPLGDIIASTPIVVGSPAEYYHQLYRDLDYVNFIQYAKDRETVIYVGANDGMLHAFTNWKYAEELASEYEVSGTATYVAPSGAYSGERIGDELWAYIPQSLLPQLKWQALNSYTHTFYVDAEVRVFDAKILPNGTYYSGDGNNYGTFLVVGLNMGGKPISVNEDFGSGTLEQRTFYPTYTMLDITDPRNPKLMWERTYTDLGFTSSVPAPVRVGDEFFLVFGSGPTDYDGTSDQKAHFYVVDMLTGTPYGNGAGEDWIWESGNNYAYMNSPLALDVFQSYNVDAIYVAENYHTNQGWKANIHKLAIPCSTCPWDIADDDDPVYNADPYAWLNTGSILFESDRPVSVKLGASVDPLDNVLLYFGTGRYLSDTDKVDVLQNYLYGVKDPFYNREKYEDKNGDYYHDFFNSMTFDRADLFASDNVSVTTDGHVTGTTLGGGYFSNFVTEMRTSKDGWYLSMQTNGTQPSERIITEAAILGGIVLTPAFTPSDDICDLGGRTEYVGVYYETGTGYTRQVFDINAANLQYQTITIDNQTNTEEVVAIRDDDLVIGNPPPKVPLHAGSEKGARAKPWNSDIQVNSALYFKSIITEWWDDLGVMTPQCTWEQ